MKKIAMIVLLLAGFIGILTFYVTAQAGKLIRA